MFWYSAGAALLYLIQFQGLSILANPLDNEIDSGYPNPWDKEMIHGHQKEMSKEALVVLESASNVVRFVESLAMKYSNPTGGFGGVYPQNPPTVVASFPYISSSPNIGNTLNPQQTDKPIQPFDLTSILTGFSRKYIAFLTTHRYFFKFI